MCDALLQGFFVYLVDNRRLMKKASLADIAKALSVSKTLVSLVLNGKGNEVGINVDTQKRVVAKAQELNYKPNQFARGLRMGKSNTLGLVVSDISNTFYAKICRSAEDYAARNGYNLFICSSDENAVKELHLIQMLVDRQVDGLIISTSQETTKEFTRLKKLKLPFVLIDRHFPRLDANYVTVDNFQGGYDATKHLLDIGHKRVGHLTISPSHLITVKERTRGYREALKDAGIRYEKSLVREIPFYNIHTRVKQEVKELLRSPHNISALFVANNNLATAVIECMNELQLRIPHDLALVSFDDVELFKLCYPPVTAVSQPIEEIGRKATEILIGQLKNPEKIGQTEKVVLKTDLVIRRSCGSFIN